VKAHGTAARYKRGPDQHGQPGRGCRCTPCRGANTDYHNRRRQLIAYGRWEALTDATGTQRRLQALVWNGWSLARLSARLGTTKRAVVILRSGRVTGALAARVRALYDDLWDQPPPMGTWRERQGAAQARNYARARGWVPAAAWDDDEIDDPAARPADGWERDDGRQRRERGALAAEVADLIGFGLDIQQAADRLGVDRSTLSTTLARVRAKETRNAAA
jgi:hypothetical protein